MQAQVKPTENLPKHQTDHSQRHQYRINNLQKPCCISLCPKVPSRNNKSVVRENMDGKGGAKRGKRHTKYEQKASDQDFHMLCVSETSGSLKFLEER